MSNKKTIALVAHDNRKKDLAEWVEWNLEVLKNHKIICTGTTGSMIEEIFKRKFAKAKTEQSKTVTKLKSGPLGGDQQLGAMIAEGKIDIFIFLWDPMEPHPHDVDVKALLRISTLYNVPTACNRATADFLISSELFNQNYTPQLKDYGKYINRKIDIK